MASDQRAGAESENDRLDSWKEIASYLNRSVRTVQNWEKEEGLPVHRHSHRRQGSVYAYRSEVDEWWRRDQPANAESGPRVGVRSVPVLAAVAAALVLVWLTADRSTDGERASLGDVVAPRFGQDRRLTSHIGLEEFPSWSPAGVIAFHSDRDGEFDIWTIPAVGGEATSVSSGLDGQHRFPAWSPDGAQLAFWSSYGGGSYVVTTPAGEVLQRVESTNLPTTTDVTRGPPLWSSDGSELAWAINIPRSDSFDALVHVEIHDLRTGETRAVELPNESYSFDASWSPDGRLLAFTDAHSPLATTTFVRVSPLSGDPAKTWTVSDGTSRDRFPIWSPDGRTLYFVSDRKGSMDLWSQRMNLSRTGPVGPPVALTAGADVRNAASSPDGTRLVYSKGRMIANVWRVPLLRDRPARWSDAEPVTSEETVAEQFDLSPDGQSLVVSSDRRGRSSLWLFSIEDATFTRLTDADGDDWGPRWSPDGTRVAFYSGRSGNRDVWILTIGDASLRRLTSDPANDMYPTWSPDGARIAFMSDRNGDFDVFTVPSEGGEPVALTSRPRRESLPKWSPRGDRILFYSRLGGMSLVESVSSSGGEPEVVRTMLVSEVIWNHDGTEIFLIQWDERQIFAHTADGSLRRLTALEGRPGRLGQEGLATDGRFVYFRWDEEIGDLWTLDLANP